MDQPYQTDACATGNVLNFVEEGRRRRPVAQHSDSLICGAHAHHLTPEAAVEELLQMIPRQVALLERIMGSSKK
jgi:hypothetical protein